MKQNNNKNNSSSVNVPKFSEEQKTKMREEQAAINKQKRRYQIIVIILSVISVAITADYMIEMITQAYTGYEASFFAKYLALGFGMFSVGAIALFLPIIAHLGNKYTEGKGDSLIVVIAFILFLAGLIAIVYSFLNIK